ncbi:MAG: SBBP repeat-containing protein [Candidatus Hermodarchaeota archaeon]
MIVRTPNVKNAFFLLVILFITPGLAIFTFLGDINTDSKEYGARDASFPLFSRLKEEGVPLDVLTKHSLINDIDLPFSGFIQNLGQVPDETIKYYYSADGTSVGFGSSFLTFMSRLSENKEPVRFSVTFSDSEDVIPVGKNQNNHHLNYFLEDFQLIDVPTWNEIWYHDLYPSIDLRYYMSTQGLKYEFIVHPGADPTQIVIQVSNSMDLTIDAQIVSIKSKNQFEKMQFEDTMLQVFQADGTSISAQFIRNGIHQNCYGFQIGQYDPTQTLIIDPLVLSFSTFVGGYDFDAGYGITLDATGNIYITGGTASNNFPTKNAYNSTRGYPYDAFVTKLNATGNGIIYSTFLGGVLNDFGHAIAVDTDGNSYITGITSSGNFPIQNAYNSTFSGATDAFVTKLNATGNGLIFSTFLGGNDEDWAYRIAVDGARNSYIVGTTKSSNFPTKNAYNSTYGGYNSFDAFVTKLNATGNGLVFSTFLGGYDEDEGFDLVVDATGNSYITGFTESSNFPTKNAYSINFNGGPRDVFVTKLNATGNGLIFSTYLGGDNWDEGNGIAIDGTGNSYITGWTSSSNFPTKNAYQSTYGGSSKYDAFVTKLNATGNGIIYSTFLGGVFAEYGNAIAVDTNGNSYITGQTASSDFPIKNAYQSTFGGGEDVFVTKLNTAGNGLVFSTYLSGSGYERGVAISLDINGNSYITGQTASSDFPIKNAYNSSWGGSDDAFATKLVFDETPPSISLNNPTNNTMAQADTVIDLNIADDNIGLSHVLYNWDGAANLTLETPYDVILPPSEVQHVLSVYANDSAGNWASKTFVFTTDTTAPTITLTSPINGSTHSSGTTIDLSITDANGVSQVVYNWDDNNNVTLNSPYNITLPTGNGQHVLRVYAKDYVGNWAAIILVFITEDVTMPTSGFEAPLIIVILQTLGLITISRSRSKSRRKK